MSRAERSEASGTQPPVKGLDLVALRAYLDGERPGLVRGELTAELIQGGRSNLTYFVGDGSGSWVVRRPPLGHVLSTAHDMSREYRVLSALAGTAVPVPVTIALCADPEVIGAPFYVMERVDGAVYRDAAQAAPLGPDRIAGIAGELVDVLADLHAVDPDSVGLGDFGRPEGYLDRQLRRWAKQLAASRSRDIPGIDDLQAQLAARLPGPGAPTGIVHGDYRLDNVIIGADDRRRLDGDGQPALDRRRLDGDGQPALDRRRLDGDGQPALDRVAAVLDWEMATLGDQLTDLGLLLMYWENMLEAAASREPFPAGAWLADRYAQRSGADLTNLSWYAAFAYFKLAVIAEGIHFRYVAGQTLGEGFEQFGALVPVLVEHGHAALTRPPT